MNTLNRLQAPALQPIQNLELLKPEVISIGENSDWIWMKEVSDETVQLTLIFDAGSIHGDVLIAAATNALLFSGTKSKTSTHISDELSKLGAYFSPKLSKEESSITFYCLKEYFDQVMTIVVDAIENVIFSEEEIAEYKQDTKQAFLLGQKKSSWVATRLYNQNLMTNSENYCRISEVSDIENIQRNQLIQFHKTNYLAGLKTVVCIANLEKSIIDKWVNKFSSWDNQQALIYIDTIQNNATTIYQELDNAVQTSFRIGIPLFNKTHQDYPKMTVLDTVLGGYFGSRLMNNIREDKGYTYGIGSNLVQLMKTGYISIGTDVKKEVREDALTQIKIEIQRLKDELIPDEELMLVKNYMIGNFLQAADGSDAMTYLYLSTYKYGLTNEYYDYYLKELKEVTAVELRELARKYLNMDKATIIMVG